MINSRSLVLFTLFLGGAARRSFTLDYSHHNAQQQSNTLTKALELSAGGREGFVPADFRTTLLRRQGARAGVAQASSGWGLPRQPLNGLRESTLYGGPKARQSFPPDENPSSRPFASTTRIPVVRKFWPRDLLRQPRARVDLQADLVQKEDGVDSTNQTVNTYYEGDPDGEAWTEDVGVAEELEEDYEEIAQMLLEQRLMKEEGPEARIFMELLLRMEGYDDIVELMQEFRQMVDTTFLQQLETAVTDARWASFNPGEAGEAAAEVLAKLLNIQNAAQEVSKQLLTPS